MHFGRRSLSSRREGLPSSAGVVLFLRVCSGPLAGLFFFSFFALFFVATPVDRSVKPAGLAARRIERRRVLSLLGEEKQ